MKITIFALVSLLVTCGVIPCIHAEKQNNTILENGYDVKQVYSSSGQNDVAIGDFDSSNPGNEIAVAIQDYKVAEIYNDGTGWKSRIIYQAPSSFEIMRGIAVGDVDPTHPGDEVVVVTTNMRMNATLIWGSGTTWHAKELFNDSAALLQVAIGELDSTAPGEEVVTVGYSKNVTLIKKSGSNWTHESIWRDPIAIYFNDVTIGDCDSLYPGNEIVTTSGNSSIEFYNDAGTWKYNVLPCGKNGVAIGDFDSSNPGNEIAVIYPGLNVYELYGSGSSWNSRKLWTTTDSINSIAVGEFNSSNPGDEIVFSYHDDVEILSGAGTSWIDTHIFTNPDSAWYFFGIAVGDVDPTHVGNEIILAGEKGKTFELGQGTFVPEMGTIFVPVVSTVAVFALLIYRKKR